MKEAIVIDRQNDEMKHYGVLGMKWGVRRDKKLLEAHTIKKGTKMYRATTNPNESTSGHKYVTYLAPDRDNYRSKTFGGEFILDNNKAGNELHEKKYVLSKDIKVAGRKEIDDVINNLWDKDQKATQEAVLKDQFKMATAKGFKMLDQMKESGQMTDKEYKTYHKNIIKMGKERVADLVKDGTLGDPNIIRSAITTNAFGGQDELRNKVIDALKKQGFNAMSDEASIGNNLIGRIGVDPLIIFDGSDTLQEKSTKKVSKIANNVATANYRDWVIKANQNKHRGRW